MRFQLLVLAAALLQASGVHHRVHHKKAHHKAHHKSKHHGHHEKHKTSTYAGMQHSLEKMVQQTSTAEAQLEDSCRRLEEAILDIALSQPNSSAPSATKDVKQQPVAKPASANALRGSKKLPTKLQSTLKTQQGKLGDLFSHLKANIANFNKREAEEKKDSQVYVERLKKRLKEDKKRLEDPKLSAFDREMLVNRTRTEEHEVKFWERGRELQHGMFHSNLKLTHGMMSRVKTVMEAYKQVMATGKLDPKLSQVLHETSASMPKALIQKEQVVKNDVRKLNKHLKISAKLLNRD